MARVGDYVGTRGITGRVSVIVRYGDLTTCGEGMKRRPYQGESFAVVVDRKGRSHHVLLREIELQEATAYQGVTVEQGTISL